VKGWHGLEPVTQICPKVEFPPGTPFTLQLSDPLEDPPCEAVNVMRSLIVTVAVGGEMAMLAPETIVMLAWTCLVGSAWGVTVMSTVSGWGAVIGAV
jgi:hypothetical protein